MLFRRKRPRRSYREIFMTSKSAENYDDRVYSAGSSGELVWRVESGIVGSLVADMRHTHERIDYLDFACGTGRLIAHLEPQVDAATGIDVSPFMLERAVGKVQGAQLLCRDVTAPGDSVEGRYDLVTAFRFLTNAEPELRTAALAALRRRMKDGRSILLINVHGNPWSYRLVSLPHHWLRDRIRGRRLFGYMSRGQARRLLEDAGFVVERVIGMGFVPQKLLPFIPARLALGLEQHLAGMRVVQALGLNQLFVCRPRITANAVRHLARELQDRARASSVDTQAALGEDRCAHGGDDVTANDAGTRSEEALPERQAVHISKPSAKRS